MSDFKLQSQERAKACLQQQLLIQEQKLRDAEQHFVDARQKDRIKKLIRAGKVIEDAGLLDDYNENDLYLLLVMNRNILRKSHSVPEQGRFDLMKGLDI